MSGERVDPFAYDQKSLRKATEYVALCRQCGGSGQTPCGTCKGSGRAPCPGCQGTGKQRSEKTGRQINCKACRGKRDAYCTRCDASGTTDCATCLSSGHEAVWFSYEESTNWAVALDAPESIRAAHPALVQLRPLGHDDWSMFSVAHKAESTGPLTTADLEANDRMFVLGRAKLDAQRERATHQQFVRLAVVRRDAKFAMCGTEGVLVLSGRGLVGGSTEDALRPIKRRLFLWPVMVMMTAVCAWMARNALVGQSAYFSPARKWTSAIWLVSVLLSVPALGAALRSWRGGIRFQRRSGVETLAAAATAVSFLAMLAVGAAAAPSIAQVQSALAKGNVQLARLVMNALKEREPSAKVVAVEDDVMIAEAASAGFEQKLALLDQVAARNGKKATEAASAALGLRNEELRRLIHGGDAQEALLKVSLWFPNAKAMSGPTAELAAQAFTLRSDTCTDEPCRLALQRAAYATSPSAERAAKANHTRARLLATLEASPNNDYPLAKVRNNKALLSLATSAFSAADGDPPLAEAARAAAHRASEAIQSVAVVGATREVVDEILGSLQTLDATASRTAFPDADVYAAFDKKGVCRGLYAVGQDKSARRIPENSAHKLLSQAVGRTAQVKQPSDPGGDVKWSEGPVRVVARWHDSDLVELRVGSAEP